MYFLNKTLFPANAWANYDASGKKHNTVMVRVKFLFKEIGTDGVWNLKLDDDQGELFDKDVFYEEDGAPETCSALYESDLCPFKPKADIIINANAHAPGNRPASKWSCGFNYVRQEADGQTGRVEQNTLLEKTLVVTGKRQWRLDKILWYNEWILSEIEKTAQVPLRYEYAYGGKVLNPEFKPEEPISAENIKYLSFFDNNPVGAGLIDKNRLIQQELPEYLEVPQILYADEAEKIERNIAKRYPPQAKQVAGFGVIHRAWQPRRDKSGTEDEQWQKNESYNNNAPEDQQFDGYARFDDIIRWHNLSTGNEEQAVRIPMVFFRGTYHTEDRNIPFYLDIDTVILDLREDKPEDWFMYVSWRKRVPHVETEAVSLDMLLSEEFANLDNPDEEVSDG